MSTKNIAMAFDLTGREFLQRGVDVSRLSLVLRNFFQKHSLVKPATLKTLAEKDPHWDLWFDDLADDVDPDKFFDAGINWIASVLDKPDVPVTEKGLARYFKNLRPKQAYTTQDPSDQFLAPPAIDNGYPDGTKIDDASWQLEGSFPENLDEENVYSYIGFFMAWVCLNGLYSASFQNENADLIRKVIFKNISPNELGVAIDGKILVNMLCKNAAGFAKSYFSITNGSYYKDLTAYAQSQHLASIFHIKGNWTNYKKVASRIDASYKKWRIQI